MVVRLKGAVIDAVEDTETKKLKLLRIASKSDGATLTLELPVVLCDKLKVRDSVNVVIDSKPMLRGEKAKLYATGSVFRMKENGEMEVVGTIGGLKLVFTLAQPRAAQRKTFDSRVFYLMIS